MSSRRREDIGALSKKLVRALMIFSRKKASSKKRKRMQIKEVVSGQLADAIKKKKLSDTRQ